MEKLLFGLGIRQVGSKTAKILAKKFKNIDDLIKADYDTLNNINDIGPIIAKNVVNYFNDSENINLINELKELGLNTTYIGNTKEDKEEFLSKRFVLTGTLSTITRDEASKMIEDAGGKVSNSVSSKTSAVIVGENPGSKYEQAKKLNIPIWSEEEFLEKIK